MTWLNDFLKEENGERYTVTYNKYTPELPVEQRRMKPTDIFTNHKAPGFLPPSKNGDPDHAPAPRGARTGNKRE